MCRFFDLIMCLIAVYEAGVCVSASTQKAIPNDPHYDDPQLLAQTDIFKEERITKRASRLGILLLDRLLYRSVWVRKSGIYDYYQRKGDAEQAYVDFMNLKPYHVQFNWPNSYRGKLGNDEVELHLRDGKDIDIVFVRRYIRSDGSKTVRKMDIIEYIQD